MNRGWQAGRSEPKRAEISEYVPDFAWPPTLDPKSARLHVRNTRVINAPPAAIWSWLVAATQWHQWFPNATNVSLLAGAEHLELDTSFIWSQSGLKLQSTVRECVPHRRLAWDANSALIKAYHAWDLSPQGDRTLVITEESQRGLMPTLIGVVLKPMMLTLHDRWLECLERQALTGYAR